MNTCNSISALNTAKVVGFVSNLVIVIKACSVRSSLSLFSPFFCREHPIYWLFISEIVFVCSPNHSLQVRVVLSTYFDSLSRSHIYDFLYSSVTCVENLLRKNHPIFKHISEVCRRALSRCAKATLRCSPSSPAISMWKPDPFQPPTPPPGMLSPPSYQIRAYKFHHQTLNVSPPISFDVLWIFLLFMSPNIHFYYPKFSPSARCWPGPTSPRDTRMTRRPPHTLPNDNRCKWKFEFIPIFPQCFKWEFSRPVSRFEPSRSVLATLPWRFIYFFPVFFHG